MALVTIGQINNKLNKLSRFYCIFTGGSRNMSPRV